MSSQGSTELPESNVEGTRLSDNPRLFWDHNRIPPHLLVATFRPGTLVIDLIPQVEDDKRQVKQAHEQRKALLNQEVDQAILTLAGSLTGLSEVQAAERKLTAASQLQVQLAPLLQIARQQAVSFFGKDPEHRTFQEFMAAARKTGGPAEPYQAWLASYRAAFEVKVLERQLSLLTQRQHSLRSALSTARLKESRNRSIDASMDSVEQAIVSTLSASHDLQMALGAMQRLLSAFERHQHDDVAKQAALEHSRELERETSDLLKTHEQLLSTGASKRSRYHRLTSEIGRLAFTLRFHAAEISGERRDAMLGLQARAQALVDEYTSLSPTEVANARQLWITAGRAIEAAFDEQNLLTSLSGRTPSNTPVTFSAWTASTRHPLVLTTSHGGTAHFEPVWEALGEALGTGAQRLLANAAKAALRHLTLLLYSSRLGDGERMGITVPLALMTPGADLTQEANRKVGQSLELPLRMNAIPQGNQTEVYLAAPDGSGLLRDVRVRQAQWDVAQGAYRFTAEGPGGATLLWHPATPPSTEDTVGEYGNVIPGATIVEDLQKHLPGNIIVPPQPDIRTFPELPDLQIDDYVIIFPADSGLAPIYVMLRSPRNLPGVASGNGVITPDRVLDAATTAAGAPIPARIAEKLRGRRFGRFDRLREAIWMEIAADEVFKQHLELLDADNMRNGAAPYAPENQWVGRRMKIEIHHKHEIASGGAVYDLDNLLLMTPQVHIDHHKENNQ